MVVEVVEVDVVEVEVVEVEVDVVVVEVEVVVEVLLLLLLVWPHHLPMRRHAVEFPIPATVPVQTVHMRAALVHARGRLAFNRCAQVGRRPGCGIARYRYSSRPHPL